MTPVEKWNVFSASADLPVALLMLCAGVVLIAGQKKFAASRRARVARGELSEDEAKKNEKLVRWCSYCVAACGAFLLIMWALGY